MRHRDRGDCCLYLGISHTVAKCAPWASYVSLVFVAKEPYHRQEREGRKDSRRFFLAFLCAFGVLCGRKRVLQQELV